MDFDIREKLKQLMEDRCYIQAAIARKANIEPDKLSLILNKKRKMDANELFKICEVIGVTPTELRNYETPIPPEQSA